MYIRDQKSASPGNGAPQIRSAAFAPRKGTESVTEYAIAIPIPESRSSTSE
jgi:hypothetical protein